MVKNLPAMQEIQIRSLSWEYLLEKEMATHSSILAREIPWTEEHGGLESMGLQRVGCDLVNKHHHHQHGLNTVGGPLGRAWRSEATLCLIVSHGSASICLPNICLSTSM